MEQDFIIKRLDNPSGGRFYQAVHKEGEILWEYPSVTHILGEAYPTGFYLIKWIRDNGGHGQEEFEKAADQGTEVHVAIEKLLNGEPVPTIDMKPKILKCIQAFIDWHDIFKPKVLKTEQIVFSPEHKYAGACDLTCELDVTIGKVEYKGLYVIDFKTSASLHDQHLIQNAAYAKIVSADAKTALLHLGNKTKAKWSFKDYDPEPYFKQFLLFKQVFDTLFPNAEPSRVEYPEIFKLPIATT